MITCTLTREQTDAYFRDGYVVLPSLFGPADLKKVVGAINELVEMALARGDYAHLMELEPGADGDHRAVRRLFDPFLQHEAFRQIATDPRILGAVASLIGQDLNIQHSKLNMKPAKVGSVVEWHQDLSYFPHTNDSLVTGLIYLDDATEENGCLQALPRHHHHFFDHTLPDGAFAGMITETIDDGRYGPVASLPAPAGSAILMHCITPHSSLPNRSDKGRRTLIFQYRAADAFPIYAGPYTAKIDSTSRHVAGQPAKYARFGGPLPPIPRINEAGDGHFKSLYVLQDEARQAHTGRQAAPLNV